MKQKIFATAFLTLFLLSLTMPTISANETLLFIRVEPSYRSIKAGEAAIYSIKVESLTRFPQIVTLSIEGLPENAIGIFTPERGRIPFRSKLTIITTIQTPAGTYELTIIAISGDEEIEAKTALIVNPPEAIITSTSTTQIITKEKTLYANVQTDKTVYNQNETVKISGSVQDQFRAPVASVEVSIQVVNPLGNVVHSALITTNNLGIYFDNFTIGELGYSIFIPGVYTVFVTASKEGYIDGYAHTSFVVGEANTPSINFVSINITDLNGEVRSEFTQGEALIIWVTVENYGTTLEKAYIWIEVDDPNGAPLGVYFNIGDLEYGKAKTVGFSFTISANAYKGVYLIKAFVSNDLISRGGEFLASTDSVFMVN